MATLTIIGLYNYDEHIFDDLAIPAAINRETLIMGIMETCGNLETFLPDPAIMRKALKYWSRRELAVWSALQETNEYDYNPIWNKDGTFYEKETRDLKGTGKTGTVNAVSAYDQSGFTNQARGDVDAATSDTGTVIRERTERGNIGLTSTQQLIQEQREVVKFNLYDLIIDEFKQRFCVLVY